MKKIKKFDLACKAIDIPINEIRIIENCIKHKKGKIYIVGGAVRELILNNKSKNKNKVDLVVNIRMSDLLFCLERSNLKYIPLGIKFGSIIVIVNGFKIDVTIMRSDIKSDGRWAEVVFTNDIKLDSKRRDFSINSIYCDSIGNIYDPNNGVKDLLDGRIRFIGDINKRVQEDFLRIIRFFRFTILYSKSFDRKTIKILNGYFKNLKSISFERKFDEIKKILSYEKLHIKIKKITIMNELKSLIQICFNIELDFNGFDKFCALEHKLDCIDHERRFKYIIRNSQNKINFTKKLSKKFANRLLNQIQIFDLNNLYLEKILYENDKFHVEDKILFYCVEKKVSYKEIIKARIFIKNYKKKQFPLRGEDLVKVGFEQGVQVGKALKNTEIWWKENNFSKNKKSCIKFALKYLP